MRRIVFVFIIMLLTVSAQAQTNDQPNSWQVVIYNAPSTDGEAETLIVIRESGVADPIALPQIMYQPTDQPEDYVLQRLMITPNLRYLILNYTPAANAQLPVSPLIIYDRENDTQIDVEIPLNFTTYYSLSLSPDGSQIAVSYVGGESADAVTVDGEIEAGLMVVDVATGKITAGTSFQMIQSTLDVNYGEWVMPLNWIEADYVPFIITCFFCSNIASDQIWHWEPATGALHATTKHYFNFGALLAQSGEVLVARLNGNYPRGEDDPDAYLPPSNVIEYYAPEDDPTQAGTVVFFDEERYPLGGSPWVYDGRAFLTRKQGDPRATLVFRDGSQTDFDLPLGPVIVVGTPNGAIIVDETGNIYDYRVSGDHVTSEIVGQIHFNDAYNLNTMTVIYSTPIGASSAGKRFPTVPELRRTAMR